MKKASSTPKEFDYKMRLVVFFFVKIVLFVTKNIILQRKTIVFASDERFFEGKCKKLSCLSQSACERGILEMTQNCCVCIRFYRICKKHII